MNKNLKGVVFFSFIFLVVDQILKIFLSNYLNLGRSIILIKNLLSITLVHNEGAAFGLFSGNKFVTASCAMRIMIPIVVLIPFSAMTNQQTFIPMGKENLILISTCIGAATNLILNSILIPRYAQNGAAMGTVMAETAVAIVCMINVQRYFDIKEIFKTIWQYCIAALPIPLIVVLMSGWNLYYVIRIILIIIFSSAIYFTILMSLKNPYIREAANVIQYRLAVRKERFHK